MANDIETIRKAMTTVWKADFLTLLRRDYAQNERAANNTPSEAIYNSCMNRLRDLRTAIAHIEANDSEAFRECPIGVYVVADYHAGTIFPDQ